MENQKSNVTIVAQCYRYIWKTTDGSLCVRYLTDIQEGHAKFQKALREDENVVSALREYQHEVNYAYIGFTEPVKEEKKEEKQDEKKNDNGRE